MTRINYGKTNKHAPKNRRVRAKYKTRTQHRTLNRDDAVNAANGRRMFKMWGLI